MNLTLDSSTKTFTLSDLNVNKMVPDSRSEVWLLISPDSLKAQVAYGYITQLVVKAHKVAKVTTQMEIWHAAEGIH